MTRHIADSRTPSAGARARRFLEVERKQGDAGSHPASQALTRRPKDLDDTRRVQEFVRIARGLEA
jgi:hypothetical protein